jgi:hypothetical protein
MKRAGRWLFNIAAGTSLVLCAAIFVTWIRVAVFGVRDSVQFIIGQLDCDLSSARQKVIFYGLALKNGPFSSAYVNMTQGPGFHYRFVRISPDQFTIALGVPYWFLAIASSILPAFAFWRRSHPRKLEAGLCRVCGYDLRATPERCPECGTVPEAAKV